MTVALGIAGLTAGVVGITGLGLIVAVMFCRAAALGDQMQAPPMLETTSVLRDLGHDVEAVNFGWTEFGQMERN